MKKIININLAGRVIPIEDSAYESLQRYIESLRRYFAKEEGKDEIINDIESRIAELMNDKIRRGAASITDSDIEEIIGSMGRVEDFEAADAEADPKTGTASGESFASYTETSRKPKGRLYRDNSDKFIGGVCSGVANYLNVDPAIIRLLFAIVALGSFGFGCLLYIFLWIFVPARNLDTYVGKRLYRNPDDQIIGGVCGGLAAYFGRSSKVVRVIFAAPLILNIFFSLLNALFSLSHFEINPLGIVFGSITSTFILVYMVLWIVLPQARSSFEKMEMRGEKVDVNRIWQNVQANMSDIETKAKAWGEEATEAASRFGQKAKEFADTRGRTFASEAKPVASGIVHAFKVLIKAFVFFILGSLAFGLFVGLMVLIFGGGSALWPLKQALLDFVLDGFWEKFLFWCTIIFFIAVPIIALMTWLIRRIMRVRSRRSNLSWIFGGLWGIGWICFILFVSLLARDFRTEQEVVDEIRMTQPANGRLLLVVNEPPIRYKNDLFFTDADDRGWDFTDDSLKLAHIDLDFDASRDSNYYVSVIRESAGRDYNQAALLANRIKFTVNSMDSILELGSGYAIARNDKFRGQRVSIVISVPVGKKVRFDPSVAERLNPSYRVRRSRHGVSVRYDNKWAFGYKTDMDYIMNKNGSLQSEEKLKEELEESLQKEIDEQQTNGNDTINTRIKDSIDKAIQEEERKQEESQRRIRQLQQERNNRTGYQGKDEDGALLFMPSFLI